MINAGKYNKKINIYTATVTKDSQGFQSITKTLTLSTYANVKTTRGMTIIKNNSDFEKALTNFTIRYPHVALNRDMIVEYNGKEYTIEYLNNIDEANIEIEMQCKEITH